jgi:phage tail tube protein FII
MKIELTKRQAALSWFALNQVEHLVLGDLGRKMEQYRGNEDMLTPWIEEGADELATIREVKALLHNEVFDDN